LRGLTVKAKHIIRCCWSTYWFNVSHYGTINDSDSDSRWPLLYGFMQK